MTTGSIAAAAPVEIQQPLPPTLAYSDASKIGETAAGALARFGVEPSSDWINASTGSSGTLVSSENAVAAPDGDPKGCRLFNTIVTSFRGVHQYAGRICAGADGRARLQIEEPGQPEATGTAPIS